MNVRTRQAIEAALDPKGKWYGVPRPVAPARQAPDVEPVGREALMDDERGGEEADWAPVPTRPFWDEWEPA